MNFIAEHTADTITITFEDYLEGGTAYWGIRNLSISLELCAIGCQECVMDGADMTDKCSVCVDGLLLFDKGCVEECPSFTTETAGVCVDDIADTYSCKNIYYYII